jgi:phosphoribosylpyrophosphate synthetase
MLLDPHTPQVEGFFDLIVDMLKVGGCPPGVDVMIIIFCDFS